MCTTRARTTCNLPCRYVHVLGTPRARGRARDVPARTCRAHVAQDRERGFQKQLTCTTCARVTTCNLPCRCVHVLGTSRARDVPACTCRAHVVHDRARGFQKQPTCTPRARKSARHVRAMCTRKNEKKREKRHLHDTCTTCARTTFNLRAHLAHFSRTSRTCRAILVHFSRTSCNFLALLAHFYWCACTSRARRALLGAFAAVAVAAIAAAPVPAGVQQ